MSVVFYFLFSNDEMEALSYYPEIEAGILTYGLMLIKIEMLRFVYTPIKSKMRYKS